MSVRRIAIFIFLRATISASARAQVSSHDPNALLKRALHFGDGRNQDLIDSPWHKLSEV
jgi:hypothetical protein